MFDRYYLQGLRHVVRGLRQSANGHQGFEEPMQQQWRIKTKRKVLFFS
jgi:hypothetical protein